MSSENRHLLLAILLGLVLAGGGSALLALPAYREGGELHAEVKLLRDDVRMHDHHLRQLTEIEAQLSRAERDADANMKIIPEVPDEARLMRTLSLPVDDVAVCDQTFTKGTASPVLADNPPREMLMPVIVDMDATFESVFALLITTERLDQLVRVQSLRLAAIDRDKNEIPADRPLPQPVLTASIGLEIIYDPSAGRLP